MTRLFQRFGIFLIFVKVIIKLMDVTAFIRELLFSHDCVIVPGFGGLIGNYTPARIDKSTSTFYPPVKQISFNRNLNHNDGLLVGRVSDHSKISYGDARNIVEGFVTGLRKKLERGEKVVFDNIGSFINNQEGNVQFEPDRNVNYHLDSYGLESFQFPPLEGYDVRSRIAKHIDKNPVKHSSTRKILWRAAVIVPLLALMVAVPLKTKLFKSKVETSSLNPLAKAEFESNREAVDQGVPKATINAGEEKIQQPVVETVIPVVEVTDSYYIITGSFKIRQNADIQVSMLSKQGYTPEIIEGPNGFYRVSAMKCIDLNAAEGKRDSISNKFPGSWVKKI
ncbi:MAG: SPOR domain-containing protein [Bacteroidia bacterium]|nr:SPOR domain-containing protein [Bacteroidia bacterium]